MKKSNLIKTVGVVLAVCVATAALVGGCGNKDMFDTVYTYDKVIMEMPDGQVVKGDVESWTDYEDGDQLQIKVNGETYLVHSEDCVLISE